MVATLSFTVDIYIYIYISLVVVSGQISSKLFTDYYSMLFTTSLTQVVDNSNVTLNNLFRG